MIEVAYSLSEDGGTESVWADIEDLARSERSYIAAKLLGSPFTEVFITTPFTVTGEEYAN